MNVQTNSIYDALEIFCIKNNRKTGMKGQGIGLRNNRIQMKFIRYVAYLLYSYYSDGTGRNVAYGRAISVMTVLIFFHILILSSVFNIEDYLPLSMEESKSSRMLKIALFMSPVFLLLYFGVKEKKLEDLMDKYAYNYDKEFDHRVILFVYFGLSFAALIVLAVLKKS